MIEEYFKTLQEYYNASNVLEFIEKLLLEKLNISEDIYKYGRKTMAPF